jgi:hypothetical protein
MQHRLIVMENKVMNLYIYRINHLNQIMRKYNLEIEFRMLFLVYLKKICIISLRIIILKWVQKMQQQMNHRKSKSNNLEFFVINLSIN